MPSISVSSQDDRRIVRLAKRLGVRSKAGVVRLAVDELERRLQRREVPDAVRAYVRKHGKIDRRENASLSAGAVARDDA